MPTEAERMTKAWLLCLRSAHGNPIHGQFRRFIFEGKREKFKLNRARIHTHTHTGIALNCSIGGKKFHLFLI